ncbi:unnamed protein product [Diamesa tonsa]
MNNLFKPTKSSQNKSNVKKSIQRNVEVPINKPIARRNSVLNTIKPNVPVPEIKITTANYDDPRQNKMRELRKSLDEIKSYKPQPIRSLQDLSQHTQEIVSKQVSSKLNFPSHQAIYKNLPKIYDDKMNIAATAVVQKTARQIKDRTRINKTSEIRDDINHLLNELVDLEYQEEDNNLMKPTRMLDLPAEEEFLGLNKFSAGEPNIYLPNKRSETKRFLDSNTKNMFEDYFISDNYLKPSSCHPIKLRTNEQGCKCINEFYGSHNNC